MVLHCTFNLSLDRDSSGIDINALDILLRSGLYHDSLNLKQNCSPLALKMRSSNMDLMWKSVHLTVTKYPCGERLDGPIIPVVDKIVCRLQHEDFMAYMSIPFQEIVRNLRVFCSQFSVINYLFHKYCSVVDAKTTIYFFRL